MSDASGEIALSLVIPLYNEEAVIGDTIREADRVLSEWGGAFEIIVVDDGSTDRSYAEARANGVDSLRLLQHETNRGYGAALKTGFASAKYPWLAIIDADGSYPIKEIPKLLDNTDEADMVIGERTEYNHYSSQMRRLGKAVLAPLANYLTSTRIPDLNSGMRVMRRKLVERYWPLIPDGFSLTTTLTMAFLSAGWRVKWIPVSFHKREGKSKIKPMRDMRNFILLILRTVTYFHPLKVYVPASLILVLSSIAVVLLSKFLLGNVMDITSLFLFITGLQLLLIGVLADLILKILGTRE